MQSLYVSLSDKDLDEFRQLKNDFLEAQAASFLIDIIPKPKESDKTSTQTLDYYLNKLKKLKLVKKEARRNLLIFHLTHGMNVKIDSARKNATLEVPPLFGNNNIIPNLDVFDASCTGKV